MREQRIDELVALMVQLTTAELDVLDDMLNEALDKVRHGDNDYGPRKLAALSDMFEAVRRAWRWVANWQDVEGD